MPLPRLLARFNKRVLNKKQMTNGRWSVLTHVGRNSGTTYKVPLESYPVEGGYVFVMMYGSRTDWVRNVLASGTAKLHVDGADVELESPRVVEADEDWSVLPPDSEHPPKWARVHEYLRMDTAA